MPDVDLFLRTSGEQRFSNFLLWQSAYAEMVFLDTLWPDVDRRHLWRGDRDLRPPRPPLRRRAHQPRWRRHGGSACAAAPNQRRAGGAGAEDLDRVLDLGEPVLVGRPARPTSRPPGPRPRRWPAAAADQVVVVRRCALPVDGLAVGRPQHVDLAGVGERLQRAVDRGQPDGVAAVAQRGVDVLGAAELVRSPASSLPRPALRWPADAADAALGSRLEGAGVARGPGGVC